MIANKLARTRLMNKDINFYNAKAQEGFIGDSSKDVIFCHWALTLMDPIIPVLKNNQKNSQKNQGVFSAIVDGDPNSANGYSDIHNIIYKFVQKNIPLLWIIRIRRSQS